MSSIKKNYFYNVIYQILAIIMPLITAPYIARILGPSGTGIYSYTHSVAQYFVIFIMLGLNNYGNKSIAKVRDNKNLKCKMFLEIYTMQLIIGILVLILFIIFQMNNFFINSYYLWFQLPFVISAIIDINWYFFGTENFKVTIIRNIIIKILTLIFIFLLVKDIDDIYKYILIMSVGSFISNLCLLPILKKEVTFQKVYFKNLIPHFKENLILFIPVIATSIYTVMDKIMITYFCDINNVGYYEYAERIKNIPLGLITAVGTVMLPRMSNIFSKNNLENTAKDYISKSMNFTMWLAIALSFGIFSVSNEFIPLFLGKGYDECIILTSYLCFSILFIAWANVVRTQYLIPKSKNSIYIGSTIIGAVVNIILNYILIPKYYAFGAVIGTLFAEFSVCLYQTIMVFSELNFKDYFISTLYYILCGIIMSFSLFIISKIFINVYLILFLKIIFGVIIYILLTFKYLNKKFDGLFIKNKKKTI